RHLLFAWKAEPDTVTLRQAIPSRFFFGCEASRHAEWLEDFAANVDVVGLTRGTLDDQPEQPVIGVRVLEHFPGRAVQSRAGKQSGLFALGRRARAAHQ